MLILRLPPQFASVAIVLYLHVGALCELLFVRSLIVEFYFGGVKQVFILLQVTQFTLCASSLSFVLSETMAKN